MSQHNRSTEKFHLNKVRKIEMMEIKVEIREYKDMMIETKIQMVERENRAREILIKIEIKMRNKLSNGTRVYN